MWYVHAMKYRSVMKRNTVLTPATAWMNLESITLHERGQTQKDKYCNDFIYMKYLRSKFGKTESRLEVPKSFCGIGGHGLMDTVFLFGMMRKSGR